MESLQQSDKDLLIQWIVDAFRRTLVHYGYWFREVEHQFGPEIAHEVERKAGDSSFRIQWNRIARFLNIELQEGLPAVLYRMEVPQLEELLRLLCLNWLANDGIWFQTVENQIGMSDAKRCNDTCWSRFSPYEAHRIKTLLGLPERGGLESLKKALHFRLYSRINLQQITEETADSFVFRMVECRVQATRKLKGLQNYPCKSGGMVEYRTFARAIDSRIETECVVCPPDPPQEGGYCAWKFQLASQEPCHILD